MPQLSFSEMACSPPAMNPIEAAYYIGILDGLCLAGLTMAIVQKFKKYIFRDTPKSKKNDPF
jgi:hypothetical protein